MAEHAALAEKGVALGEKEGLVDGRGKGDVAKVTGAGKRGKSAGGATTRSDTPKSSRRFSIVVPSASKDFDSDTLRSDSLFFECP
jgi:hypothetical protein